MDFQKISFRPSPEEQYYLERLNHHYNAPTITEFFRRFLADCRRWQVGNVDKSDMNGPSYPRNVDIIPRNEAQRYEYRDSDFEMQMIIAQQSVQIRQTQEALMQVLFQLQSIRQQQYQQHYMYYQPPNSGWFGNPFGFPPSFPSFVRQQPAEQELSDPFTLFANSAEKALRFKSALKALWP